MLAKRQLLHKILSPSLLCTTTRILATCPLPISLPTPAIALDHQALPFSLVENLTERGLYSSSQTLIRRIVFRCFSVPRAVTALDFALLRGMPLDLDTCAVVLRKFVDLDDTKFAESFYDDHIVSRGVDSDARILNSMIICYSKLGKLDQAKRSFERLIELNSFPCRAACVVLLRELCAQGSILEAYAYFIVCNDARVMMGSRCFANLIYNMCDGGFLDEALDVFDKMLLIVKSRPSANLYKSLFYGLCRQGRPVEAEQLGGEMESQGYFIDKKMFTSLMRGYCREKRMKMAMRVFFRMLKLCCEPDNYTYNTLIDGFIKLGMVDKGWVLHNQMMEQGRNPDVVTYQIMINGYCRKREVDCALTLLNSMTAHNIALNVHCYTSIIDALNEDHRFEEVDKLYNEMLDSGIVPDHVLFFKLLKKWPTGKELHLACKVLEAIAEKECGLRSSFITSTSRIDLKKFDCLLKSFIESYLDMAPVAFAICISALCAGEKVDDALCYLHKMVSLGHQPLLSTYNSLIRCLLSQGRDTEFIFNLMQNHGMQPNLDTYLITVNSCCKRNDIASAIGILHKMTESGVNPSVSIYDSIINCLCKEKRIYDAEDMFMRMLEDGIDPDEVVYVTMINGYSKYGKVKEACYLFDTMVKQGIQPSSRAYTALIYGLVKGNMIKKKYLDRMLEEGFVPNHVFFTSVISQFLRRGELEFSLRLVDLMDTSWIERDHVMYIALVSGVSRNLTRRTPGHILCLSKRSKEMRGHLFYLLKCSVVPWTASMRVCYDAGEMRYLAKRLMQEIRRNDHLPCLYLCNCVIFIYCREKRIKEAYDHLKLMQSAGVSPNHVTFTILINGHIRRGEVDHALFLFKKMSTYGCEPDKVMYNALMRGLCNADRLVDALSVLAAMHKRGLFPSKDCYLKLLYSFCVRHSSAHAWEIFQEMLLYHYLPSKNMFIKLLNTLFKAYEFDNACKVLDLLPERKAVQYLKQSEFSTHFAITKT